MAIARRTFAKSLAVAAGALTCPSWLTQAVATTPVRAAARLPENPVTRIRAFYPPDYKPNGPQAFPQSKMNCVR